MREGVLSMYLWPGESVTRRVQLLVDGHAAHVIDGSVDASGRAWSVVCCPPTRTGANIGPCLVVHIPVRREEGVGKNNRVGRKNGGREGYMTALSCFVYVIQHTCMWAEGVKHLSKQSVVDSNFTQRSSFIFRNDHLESCIVLVLLYFESQCLECTHVYTHYKTQNTVAMYTHVGMTYCKVFKHMKKYMYMLLWIQTLSKFQTYTWVSWESRVCSSNFYRNPCYMDFVHFWIFQLPANIEWDQQQWTWLWKATDCIPSTYMFISGPSEANKTYVEPSQAYNWYKHQYCHK